MFSESRQEPAFWTANFSAVNIALLVVVAYLSFSYIKSVQKYRVCIAYSLQIIANISNQRRRQLGAKKMAASQSKSSFHTNGHLRQTLWGEASELTGTSNYYNYSKISIMGWDQISNRLSWVARVSLRLTLRILRRCYQLNSKVREERSSWHQSC